MSVNYELPFGILTEIDERRNYIILRYFIITSQEKTVQLSPDNLTFFLFLKNFYTRDAIFVALS